LDSFLAVLDLSFCLSLFSPSLFLSWLAILPSPAVLLLHLVLPGSNSDALLQFWRPAPVLAPCSSSGSVLQFWLPAPTQAPYSSTLAQRIGAVRCLIPPLLGSLSQKNSSGAKRHSEWADSGLSGINSPGIISSGQISQDNNGAISRSKILLAISSNSGT